jgi:hypothetical protein
MIKLTVLYNLPPGADHEEFLALHDISYKSVERAP